MGSYIIRGVLIGGSLGIFAGLFGIVDNLPRAFLLGGIAGVLAGVTLVRVRRNKPPQ